MSDLIRHIDKSWTLFLDRDGVVNERLVDDYVKMWDEFRFLSGVKESLALFSRIFGKIIIVTNQQGVGKGLMSEEMLREIHRKMVGEIEKAGGRVDAVYYCTHLKGQADNCRKPSVAMFEQARKDFPEIIPEKSIMVGDSASDMEFGRNAGMFTVFIGTSYDGAGLTFPDLQSFATYLKNILNL